MEVEMEAEAVCRMVERVEGKLDMVYRAVAETAAEGIGGVMIVPVNWNLRWLRRELRQELLKH